MVDKTFSKQAAIRCSVVLIALALLAPAGVPGCKSREHAAKKAEQEAPPVSPVEGMKYYVGGPVMKHDAYGRLRLGGFNGEVAAPTSRGLLLGYRLEPDGRHFEYRTWVNGRAVSKSNGFLDAQGLLWFTDRETYDSNGTVLTRQTFTYDDNAKKMATTVQQLDPKTGAVIHTSTQETPYTPPEEAESETEGQTGEAEQKK